MATNTFKGTTEPARPADIQAIEEQYGFTLPEDYKAHILRYNGGFPERGTFVQRDTEKGEIEREINQFKSVRHGTITLERSLQSLRSELMMT